MTEGYMALYVSIIKGVSPDRAFKLLGNEMVAEKPGTYRKQSGYKHWNATEITIMDIMHQKGMTWAAVGRKYGINGKHARALVVYRKRGKEQ